MGSEWVNTLVRLVDYYARYPCAPSSKEVWTGLTLRLRRDRAFDVAYGHMVLRAAPGDPKAILPEAFEYHFLLPRTLTKMRYYLAIETFVIFPE